MDAAKKEKKVNGLSYEWQRVDYFFALFELKGTDEELWKTMIFFYDAAKELFENVHACCKKKRKGHSKNIFLKT